MEKVSRLLQPHLRGVNQKRGFSYLKMTMKTKRANEHQKFWDEWVDSLTLLNEGHKERLHQVELNIEGDFYHKKGRAFKWMSKHYPSIGSIFKEKNAKRTRVHE